MFLIVGLGNPGKDYENTRHNIGFDALDRLALKYNINISKVKFKGMYGEGNIQGQKVILLKPITYMNLSGESIKEVVNFYKLNHKNIIVIYDDVDLEVGRLRIRLKGSSGGHNGIKSIIYHLETEEFIRLRVGVGKAENDMISHVLGRFSKEDRSIVEKSFDAVAEAVGTIIKENPQSAMNKFNSFKAE